MMTEDAFYIEDGDLWCKGAFASNKLSKEEACEILNEQDKVIRENNQVIGILKNEIKESLYLLQFIDRKLRGYSND